MFSTNTLFILGAGASSPYGFPLGKALITNILNDMNDEILIPMYESTSHIPYWNKNDRTQGVKYEFDIFKDNIPLFYECLPIIQTKDCYSHAENQFKIGIEYQGKPIRGKHYRTVISDIDIFHKLKLALIEFDPISIDAFLRDNLSFAVAGKIMIIYSLLKREDKDKFIITSSPNEDNWYSYILNDLISGCADNPEKLLDNKIRLTTFNYELSFDYYLHDRLKKIEAFSKGAPSLTETFLKEFKIKHVYGQTYLLHDIEYGFYKDHHPTSANITKGPTINEKTLQNFKRFVFSYGKFDGIKTMYDERNHETKINEIEQNIADLKWAKDIIIIGFGFDRDNLDLLGIPDNMKELNELLRNKTIRYLNFKGTINSLSQEFLKLQEYCIEELKIFSPDSNVKSLINVIESTANNISNAYLNDFKKYLVR